MSYAASVGLMLLGAVPLGLVALTAVGARRRGRAVGVAAVCGMFFPVTWVVWYVLDERPYGRLARQ